MIIKLTLKNFKKHRDLEINFAEGLNVIRGNNEDGKSTIYHAIGYAFWGSRALPDSLEETVTWGEAASSLRVELEFDHAGTVYKISRSKSGAELEGGGSVASGQAEVSAFVERLLGANYQVGLATLIAGQASLQNGLDGEAVTLIERLSNMGIIDEYITKIQERLPAGNTKSIEEKLAELEAQQFTEPQSDFTRHEENIVVCSANLKEATEALGFEEKSMAEFKPKADAAAERLNRQQANERESARLKAQIVELETKLSQPLPPAPELNIAELLEGQKEQAKQKEILKAWRAFGALPTYGPFGGTKAEYDTTVSELNAATQKVRGQLQNLVVSKAGLKMARITQTHCGLCDKDLSAVPEVQQKNAEIDRAITEHDEAIREGEAQVKENEKLLQDLTKIAEFTKRLESGVKPLEGYVILTHDSYPPIPVWVGPATDFPPDLKDYGTLIQQVNQQEQALNRARATREATSEALAQAVERLKMLEAPVALPEDRNALVALQRHSQLIADLRVNVSTARSDLNAAEQALLHAKDMFLVELTRYRQHVANKQQLKELIDAMNFHNRLIRKLREARPTVAKELWNLILSGVSQIFSQIRGAQSVVSRGKSGFMIDGKSVSAYSGSTKDSLGLACRIMLQKTFMGNTDFMLLDEPAAACDETREVDMLAAITRAEYKQVILVTHSERADTFASNVIRL